MADWEGLRSKWCKTAPLGVNTKLMDGGSAERGAGAVRKGRAERKTTEIVFDRSEVCGVFG